MKPKIVDETPYGVFLWQIPDGRLVADEDGNFLSIGGYRGDGQRIKKLKEAARSCGIEDGHPIFFPGKRKVTDEEYDEQKQRFKDGLIPDKYDVGAYRDEIRGRKEWQN